jgi:hypothetical protein
LVLLLTERREPIGKLLPLLDRLGKAVQHRHPVPSDAVTSSSSHTSRVLHIVNNSDTPLRARDVVARSEGTVLASSVAPALSRLADRGMIKRLETGLYSKF